MRRSVRRAPDHDSGAGRDHQYDHEHRAGCGGSTARVLVGRSPASPGDRSSIQDVVRAQPEHPQPDVVVGQVHQLAASADPGQQEVTVGRPLLRAEVELRVLEADPDLEPRRLGEGQRQGATREREAEQQPAAVATELDTVVQRNARDRAAQDLLALPSSTPRSGSARSWPPLASFPTRSRRRSRNWPGRTSSCTRRRSRRRRRSGQQRSPSSPTCR